MMRFLCVCVIAVLSGMLAVRCHFTPDPTKAMANLLHGVSASDREWRIILVQNLKTNIIDPEGGVLSKLGLLTEGKGITPQKIVEWLVSHKSKTGTQLKFGIWTLGLALENQFVKTVMVHSYLAYRYADHREANLEAMRVCISSIQVALAIFANKLAFFGHTIKYFWDLNNTINEFLNTHKENWKSLPMNAIKDFLMDIIKSTKSKVALQEHNQIVFLQIIDQVKLTNLRTKKELTQINSLVGHQLYSMIIEIDTYDYVNVSSMPLDFYEKLFKIIKYSALKNPDIPVT